MYIKLNSTKSLITSPKNSFIIKKESLNEFKSFYSLKRDHLKLINNTSNILRIGIDLSTTSIGICLFYSNKYNWITITRDPLSKKYDGSSVNSIIYNYLQTDKTLPDNQIIKSFNIISNSINISRILIELIEKATIQLGPDFTVIGIESPSLNSRIGGFIDLSTFNTSVTGLFLNHFIEKQDSFYFTYISPSEIKKHLTGKGNSNKKTMMESFINKEDDPFLLNNRFFKNRLNYTKASPFNDLIDAYSINNILTKTYLDKNNIQKFLETP